LEDFTVIVEVPLPPGDTPAGVVAVTVYVPVCAADVTVRATGVVSVVEPEVPVTVAV
jgi:hypothetical protein